MRFDLKRIGFASAAVAFSLGMAACHGGSPGSSAYVPAGASVPQSGQGFEMPDHTKRQIISSCGKHVHIVLLGVVDCKFREPGYGNGTFTLTNDTKGIVLISPSSGTRSTTFTILGAVLGSGHFTVKDDKGRSITVTVKVTL